MTERFVIKRGNHWEFITVGKTGRQHGPYTRDFNEKQPPGILCKDEGEYRRAIRVAKQRIRRVTPLQSN